uniref:Sugar phosphate transporter domain-containing protein n=1 Tax=Alexandrium monilatum TaxID=311494 RepID=A0A7S4SHE8_9DINO
MAQGTVAPAASGAQRRILTLRSRARVPAMGLILTLLLATCAWVRDRAFAAPAPRARHAEKPLASAPETAHQPSLHVAASLPRSATDASWVGLAAPAALLLLAAVQAREDATACAALGPHRRSGPLSRGKQTPLHESAMNMVPPSIAIIEQQKPRISAASVAMAAGFFFWYAANVSFNIVNKQALGLFPHAWTVSVVQLATVVVCSSIGWVSGLLENPFKSMGRGFLWRLLPAALCHAVGNGLTSVAFSWGSVSFTHVVKTREPVWMALGNFLVTGAVLPRAQVLALLPIMLGVAIASAGELSFTWVGFLAALGSTIAFAGRGIFSKRLMTGEQSMSPLNVYAMDSLLALVFTLPVAAMSDGPALLVGSLGPVLAGQGPLLSWLLASTGLAYYAYNAIAFELLAKLDVVSHAVGNLGKRIFVIGFSVLAFSTPLTARAAVGSTVAILGSGLYSYVKTLPGRNQAR